MDSLAIPSQAIPSAVIFHSNSALLHLSSTLTLDCIWNTFNSSLSIEKDCHAKQVLDRRGEKTKYESCYFFWKCAGVTNSLGLRTWTASTETCKKRVTVHSEILRPPPFARRCKLMLLSPGLQSVVVTLHVWRSTRSLKSSLTCRSFDQKEFAAIAERQLRC